MLTSVVIVGAGPAGALLSFLLAREGVEVLLLERQTDFAREFRGEVLMPSGFGMFARAGLGAAFEAVPQRPVEAVEVWRAGRRLFAVEVRGIAGDDAVPRVVSQPLMLEMLVREAGRFPSFRIERGAVLRDLLLEGGRVAGVVAEVGGVRREFRGDLVVGADGRFSVARARSGLVAARDPQAFDVVWCKVPAPPAWGAAAATRVYVGRAHFAVAIPTPDDRLQIGWILSKGSFGEVRRRGMDAWLEDLARHVSPELGAHLLEHRGDAAHPFLLSVVSDRVPRWSLPGLLLLGDAAHAMSPVGGQGLNMALRDATAAGRILAPVLGPGAAAAGIDAAAARVQEARLPETAGIQARQARVPPFLFGNPLLARVVVDVLAPALVNTGLARRTLRNTLRTFARGLDLGVPDEPPRG
jgi:2-polyprenyl-6-methoxyphenol hydroxylase-like FAD-dependent oxidoreductase